MLTFLKISHSEFSSESNSQVRLKVVLLTATSLGDLLAHYVHPQVQEKKRELQKYK